MGWLDKLLGRPRDHARSTGPARPPNQRRAVTQTYVPPPPRQPADPSWTAATPTLRPEGHMRVVGESYRQEALRRVLTEAGSHRLVLAQLVRDQGNPHHSGAVAVFVGADHVGYLSRDDLGYDGQALYKALARLDRRGVPATCWARLNGGVPDKPSIGIHLLTSGYEHPDEPYPFALTVPPDSFATVLGTEAHQDLLTRLTGAREETLVGAQLTVSDTNPARPKSGGPVLLATVDGVVIGGLSAKESASRIPLVQALADSGRDAHALARIRSSSGQRGGLICSVSTLALED